MIQIDGLTYKKFTFPCGELHIEIDEAERDLYPGCRLDVTWEFENTAEIFEMMLLADTLKRLGHRIRQLTLPYVPFSRQDRANTPLECFSLKTFARIVNDLQAESVLIDDPHSDVTLALIENCRVRTQFELLVPHLVCQGPFYLVSPDAGALKKIYRFAEHVNCLGIIECSKHRDTKTGQITGTTVHCDALLGNDAIIIDDLCDGGRTFIEIAKILKQRGAGKVKLMVTHGFFTKGLQVFDGLIDEIYTRKGRVK